MKYFIYLILFCLLLNSCKRQEDEIPAYQSVHFSGTVVNKLNGASIPGAYLEFMDYSSTLNEGNTTSGSDGKFNATFPRRGYSDDQTLIAIAEGYYPIYFNGYHQPANSYTPDKAGNVNNMRVEMYPLFYVRFVAVRNDTSLLNVDISYARGGTHVSLFINAANPSDTSICMVPGGKTNTFPLQVSKQTTSGRVNTIETYSIDCTSSDTTLYILNY